MTPPMNSNSRGSAGTNGLAAKEPTSHLSNGETPPGTCLVSFCGGASVSSLLRLTVPRSFAIRVHLRPSLINPLCP
jgi:hypothetical protein